MWVVLGEAAARKSILADISRLGQVHDYRGEYLLGIRP
jgi:hypothetical protein